MPRPKKWRRVCRLPDFQSYGPIDGLSEMEDIIIMTVEEYEVIRLIDFEGLDQEQSAERMGVARSTVQRIYNDARKKIAQSLVNGKTLKIKGGNYMLCNNGKFDRDICSKCITGRHRHGNR